MARGTSSAKPDTAREPEPAGGADWSRGPIAATIALLLLIAAAALLPAMMRLGQSGAPAVALAETPRAEPAPAIEPARVLAMNEPPIPRAQLGIEPLPANPERAESDAMGAPMGIEPERAAVDAPPGSAPSDKRSPAAEPPARQAPDGEPEPEPEPEPKPVALLIDLNTAGASELELLPGIGPAMAARIIEDREAHGPFPSLEAVGRVRGIGPRTIDNLRGKAIASGEPGDESQPSPTNQPTPAARLPINTATAEELQALPGIGPALAARIIEDRQANGPFRTIEDLERVRGIGPRTIERLRPLITARIPAERR